MVKNYIKIALRRLHRQKSFTAINIIGLSIGLATCVLIFLWVAHELSFDRFYENSERIYRITNELKMGEDVRYSSSSSAPMVPAMRDQAPGAEAATRMSLRRGTWVKKEGNSFREQNVLYADGSFFDVFSIPAVAGDPRNALTQAYSVVLTESTAAKYFGTDNPVGKKLRLEDNQDYTVTAISTDVPSNSHFTYDMLVSMETAYSENPGQMAHWGWFGVYSYVLLRENVETPAVETELNDIVDAQLGEILRARGGSLNLYLQPLQDIHLHSTLEADYASVGDLSLVYLFTATALLVLLMAGFNFFNLTTARAPRRAREIGIRKTFGARRGMLVVQFLAESAVVGLLAVIVASVVLELAIPLYNEITGLHVQTADLARPLPVLALIGGGILTGLLAGLYPALRLSSFLPARVLQSGFVSGAGRSNFRRVLVVMQFAIAITLVIGTLTIYRQLGYISEKSLGFEHENVLVLSGLERLPENASRTLKSELARIKSVRGITLASAVPFTGSFNATNIIPEGFDENQGVLTLFTAADESTADVLDFEIKQGRFFSNDFASDSTEAAVINETAARRFGWENPIGKTLRYREVSHGEPIWTERKVIGVVSDFHNQSLRQAIQPTVILRDLNSTMISNHVMALRLESDDIPATLNLVEQKWQTVAGDEPFDYSFISDQIDREYLADTRLSSLALAFSLITILIACLGLFGIAAHAVEQRTKEIGLRRVLGATAGNIIALLSQESMVLVILANVIAWPIAFWLTNSWLGDFSFHVQMGWGSYLLAALLTLAAALGTVFTQALRGSRVDPIHALKYE